MKAVLNLRLRVTFPIALVTFTLLSSAVFGEGVEPPCSNKACEAVEPCVCDCKDYDVILNGTQLSGTYNYSGCVKIPYGAIIVLIGDTTINVDGCLYIEGNSEIRSNVTNGDPDTGASGTHAASLTINTIDMCCFGQINLWGGNGGSGQGGTGQAGGSGGNGGNVTITAAGKVIIETQVLLYGGAGARGGGASTTSTGGNGGAGGAGGSFICTANFFQFNGRMSTSGGNGDAGESGADGIGSTGQTMGKAGGNGGNGGSSGSVSIIATTTRLSPSAFLASGGNGGSAGGGGWQYGSRVLCSEGGGNAGAAGTAGQGGDLYFEQTSGVFVVCGYFTISGGRGGHGASGGLGYGGDGGIASNGASAGGNGTLTLKTSGTGILQCVTIFGSGMEGGIGGHGGGGGVSTPSCNKAGRAGANGGAGGSGGNIVLIGSFSCVSATAILCGGNGGAGGNSGGKHPSSSASCGSPGTGGAAGANGTAPGCIVTDPTCPTPTSGSNGAPGSNC